MVKQESVENKVMTMREMARKGGQSTRDKHGSDYYRKIGAKGAKKRAELLAKGKTREDE